MSHGKAWRANGFSKSQVDKQSRPELVGIQRFPQEPLYKTIYNNIYLLPFALLLRKIHMGHKPDRTRTWGCPNLNCI